MIQSSKLMLCFRASLIAQLVKNLPAMQEMCGEGNGNPLQCSCLENPRDGEAGWAAVYGAAQSRTRLKRLSSSSNSKEKCTGAKLTKGGSYQFVSACLGYVCVLSCFSCVQLPLPSRSSPFSWEGGYTSFRAVNKICDVRGKNSHNREVQRRKWLTSC